MSLRFPVLRLTAALALAAGSVPAQQTWNFDQTTAGQDVHWLSPTAVDPAAVGYDTTFAITLVSVKVKYLFLTFDVDVTDQLPPEVLGGGGNFAGPAPVLLFSDSVSYPPPPDPASLAATIAMGLDATGRGYFDATGITLGNVLIEVPPFGTVTAQILSVRIAGSLTIDETQWVQLGGALAGTTGEPTLTGDGELSVGQPMSISIGNALPGAALTLVVGFGQLNVPFKGGTLVPTTDLLVTGLAVGPAGTLTLGTNWPAGVPAGFTFYVQGWLVDPAGPYGLAATNGLSGTAQ
ncbi:MAG: hypothetical protein FJ296_08285 [Planctomycetes bacterium]|nr:hypothetical protein [Planctomycetota bacterium]